MLNNELFPHPAFTLAPETLARLQNGVHALCDNPASRGGGKPLYYRFLDSPVGPLIAMA